MAVSLRTRLTFWYSAWLLLVLGLFSATVLWLHWELLLREADASLDALATAAVNVVSAELAEHSSLEQAAHEMADVVGQQGNEVAVVDANRTTMWGATSAPLVQAMQRPPLHPHTVTGSDGRLWRVMQRAAHAGNQS